jgi:hypothetical protein
LSYDELVNKLVAEMRAALESVPLEDTTSISSAEDEALQCMRDALAAFDSAVEASRHE